MKIYRGVCVGVKINNSYFILDLISIDLKAKFSHLFYSVAHYITQYMRFARCTSARQARFSRLAVEAALRFSEASSHRREMEHKRDYLNSLCLLAKPSGGSRGTSVLHTSHIFALAHLSSIIVSSCPKNKL